MKFLKVVFFVMLISLCCGLASATTNITASYDAFINDTSPDTNYGNETYLDAHGSSWQNQYTFMSFYVPSGATTAYLHIYVDSGANGKKGNIYTTSPDWSESEITWNNQPTIVGSTVIDSVAVSSNDTWYTYNVSSVISQPGWYSFLYKADYGSYQKLNSTESTANTSYLEIEQYNYTDIIFNNKTNDYDRAFLVNTSESIMFSMNPLDTENVSAYKWYVNKTEQESELNTFNFTAPSGIEGQPSSEIWEIRVNATYTNGTSTYREWVISSLPESEAPDFFDFFNDLNNAYRTFYHTDPWGRNPPYYLTSNNYISKGFLTGSGSTSDSVMLITENDNITYGTFKFKIRCNTGSATNIIFRVLGNYGKWNYQAKANEYHDYFSVINRDIFGADEGYLPISRRGIAQAPGQHYWWDSEWKEITIIHTPDGWWSAWEDGAQISGSYLQLPGAFADPISFVFSSMGTNEMDCIQVYKDQYLYPNTNIYYGSYPKWWVVLNPSNYECDPVYENGIIASGQNLTLEQISASVDNESLMTYSGNTATVKTNIFLVAGSSLNITDEVLLFDTNSESLDINLLMHSTFNVENSTISTIGNNPIRWNLASAATMSIFDPLNVANATVGSSDYREKRNPRYDFAGRFKLHNSTINNTCNLFLDGAMELDLENIIFSNTSNSNYGDYTPRLNYNSHNNVKIQSNGEKALWVVPRNDLSTFTLSNISYIDSIEAPSVHVTGGEWIVNSTTFKNCNLSEANISTARAWKIPYFIQFWNLTEHSDFSLLNCKFNESKMNVDTAKSKLETKYYADVVVKDVSNNPVSNAIITSTASNNQYNAESLYEKIDYFGDYLGDRNATGPGQGGADLYGVGYYAENGTLVGNGQNVTYSGGNWRRWWNAQPLIYATTNANGRTDLPSGDVNNSIVLNDKVWTNDTGTLTEESIVYNFTVNSTGYNNITLDNIDPYEGWYRTNKDSSKYTIVATVNNSSDPHITGYAPAPEYDNYAIGDPVRMQVWASETPTNITWKQGGTVIEGETDLTCNVTATAEPVTVSFEGDTSSGKLSKTYLIQTNVAPPEVGFSGDVVSGAYPLFVNFTDLSTGDNIGQWAWDFDNNGVFDSYDQNPRAKYKAPGTYTVTLTTSNGAGSNTTTKTGYITVTGQNPIKKAVHSAWGYFWNMFYQIFGVGVWLA